jgi:hypothetical protein
MAGIAAAAVLFIAVAAQNVPVHSSPPTSWRRLPGKVSVSAAFAGIDNDGDADLYVTTVRSARTVI